jgi:hypothetical protein
VSCAPDVAGDDRGSSPVEFVLVGALITFLTLGVLQLGLSVYVRNVVHDAAVEGAYRGALADAAPSDGADRARAIIARAVGDAYADDVRAVLRADEVVVTVRSPVPLFGLIGVAGTMEVTARAPRESLE